MTTSRRALFALALTQVIIAGFFALVGSFADGGTIWARLLLVVLQPLAALAFLFLVSLRQPPIPVVLVVITLLAVNVVADGVLAYDIARGAMKGDWELPVVWAVIPAIGLVWAGLFLMRRVSPTANS